MTAKIKLNAASGGGSFSLQAPSSSANNRVFTLPDSADATLLTSTSSVGKVLQVVESTSSTTVTTSGGTEADLLTLSITPSSSSNKVLVFINFVGQSNPTSVAKAWIRLYRGTSSGTLIRTLKDGTNDATITYHTISGQKLDSPNTTSAQTYTMTLARLGSGTNTVSTDGNPYFLQAMEIAA